MFTKLKYWWWSRKVHQHKIKKGELSMKAPCHKCGNPLQKDYLSKGWFWVEKKGWFPPKL